MRIRLANSADAEVIGSVNYTSWQETYRGLIEDAYLDGMAMDGYKTKWTEYFGNADKEGFMLVLEDDGQQVIGYCSAGRARRDFHKCEGEIYTLYMLKAFHGKGWGRALFLSAINALQQQGYKSAFVCVLSTNPAVNFYRSFNPDAEEPAQVVIGERKYNDIAFAWLDLKKVQ